MTPEALKQIMLEKALTDSVERAGFIHGFRTAEKIYKGDEMKNQVEEVLQWFKLAVPEPTEKNKVVQAGCHLEEVGEFFFSFDLLEARASSSHVAQWFEESANWFKNADAERIQEILKDVQKEELLDSLCDQIVTAIGVAHMFGFDIVGALAEFNRSNFSKFVDRKPVFNEQGKIAKPNSYSAPNLDQFLGK